jgi:hypothetical protein
MGVSSSFSERDIGAGRAMADAVRMQEEPEGRAGGHGSEALHANGTV